MSITAIVLAGGSGSRMNSSIQKQFLPLKEKPVLYYSLKAFDDSRVTDIILVTGKGQEEYCQQEIIKRYHIKKVKQIVHGGKERFESVFCGLNAADMTDYILIHDGARPLVTKELINRMVEQVQIHKACVAAVPVKDTIKVIDNNGYVVDTPDRQQIWQVQTPQAFEYKLVMSAYQSLMAAGDKHVTDDAMVVEAYTNRRVKLIKGDYKNIKITTPEDLLIADVFIPHINIEEKKS